MLCDETLDSVDETIDPRVQIELEKLNTSTDEINKLEVDLDEARNQFRQILSESTIRIDNCSKKLGNCIEKARPYYDARLKAKQALQETQKAAVNFERANSAHAAAKEMVFLAEEGLKTEGRTFDHAWQEMLNHATMRVNESESERTTSEAEHSRTSQIYQKAEIRVQSLQKELKRAITKSRPYFELKIHYNNLLEQQKIKVKTLEKQVAEVKLCYAETLRNLEQISDEIHKTRQNGIGRKREEGIDVGISDGTTEEKSDVNKRTILKRQQSGGSRKKFELKTPDGEAKTPGDGFPKTPMSDSAKLTPNTPCSSQPDTDMWSESSYYTGYNEGNGDMDSITTSLPSGNDSSVTEQSQSDSESEEEFYKLPDSLRMKNLSKVPKDKHLALAHRSKPGIMNQLQQCLPLTPHKPASNPFLDGGVGICSFPISDEDLRNKDNTVDLSNTSNCWTEIKLHSPEDEHFLTVKKKNLASNSEEDFDIPYAPLSEAEGECTIVSKVHVETPVVEGKAKLDSSLASWMATNRESEGLVAAKVEKGTPKKLGTRRQSLDVLWNTATGEKVKEILSHGIMKLSIASLTERRSSESKAEEDCEEYPMEQITESLKDNETYESNLTSQFGLQFFSKKKAESEIKQDEIRPSSGQQDSLTNQIGGFISRKERFFTKKVPSPLEKTLGYLNADDDSNSDNESLTSIDMLTDEQLASLVLDQDLTEVYQDI